MELERELREKVVMFCRMLDMQGSIGMFGHVSIRVPETNRVLMNPGAGTGKSTIKPEDVFVFDMVSGEIIEHPGGKVPIEWRIHTQIHKDRPDAMCVLHTHAPYARLLSIAGKELEPVYLHGGFLVDRIPTYENPTLVVDDAGAQALSKALGNSIAVQMRAHGLTVAASCAEEAFFANTFLEENARLQVEAAAIGGAIRMPQHYAEACAKQTRNPRLFNLLWEYYSGLAMQSC